MSLNDITLSPLLLADLYHDVLIEPYATGVPEKPSQNYIGNNQKNILIVVSKNDTETINEHELDFLANVLAACKLSLAEVAIVKWPMVETNLTELLESLESKTVLLLLLIQLVLACLITFHLFKFNHTTKKFI